MILIHNLHTGRFGNKILHYNNLVQIAKYVNTEWNSISYDKYDKLGLRNDYKGFNELLNLDVKCLKERNSWKEDIKLFCRCDVKLTMCLGELFYDFNYGTREIFKVKPILDYSYTNIGIHFRGTDFHIWNPQSILDIEYYIDSIKYCLSKYNNCKFYLFTDDKTLHNFNKVEQYLKDYNINYEYGSATLNPSIDFFEDFRELCDVDIIISSPSTFAICAGFIGKEKEVIHSDKWVKYRTKLNDKFWVDMLENTDNKNYKLHKLI